MEAPKKPPTSTTNPTPPFAKAVGAHQKRSKPHHQTIKKDQHPITDGASKTIKNDDKTIKTDGKTIKNDQNRWQLFQVCLAPIKTDDKPIKK